jgi:hypothetical protein
MLGLDSMAIAKTYPEWFSDRNADLSVVLGTCQ